MTYAELLASIQTYTENDETTFVAEIPTFVKQTEERIFHTIQFPVYRRNQTSTFTIGNEYLQAPSDFVSAFSMSVTDGSSNEQFLLNKDVNFIREAYPSSATQGLPRYYTLFDDDTFLVGPTPDVAYAVELHFSRKPETIVTASTTWIGDNAEAALLYGSLIEAYTFMKGEQDIIQLYDGKYQEAMVRVKELGDGKNRKDMYRGGQLRKAVT